MAGAEGTIADARTSNARVTCAAGANIPDAPCEATKIQVPAEILVMVAVVVAPEWVVDTEHTPAVEVEIETA
jgi:hypothetical protein